MGSKVFREGQDRSSWKWGLAWWNFWLKLVGRTISGVSWGASFTKIEQDIAVRWRAWSLRKMGSEEFPGNRSSAVLRLGQIYRAIFHIDTGRWWIALAVARWSKELCQLGDFEQTWVVGGKSLYGWGYFRMISSFLMCRSYHPGWASFAKSFGSAGVWVLSVFLAHPVSSDTQEHACCPPKTGDVSAFLSTRDILTKAHPNWACRQ
jgi:hypothetical protein